MVAISYAGEPAENSDDIVTKYTVDEIIKTTSPNKTSVEADINTAVSNRVTKEYVDTQDSRYAPASEYGTKDASRNILKSLVGTPGHPVPLPLTESRFPVLGAGYILGAYGWAEAKTVSSTGTEVQIASVTTDPIPHKKKFWPVCFAQVLVSTTDLGALPIIEARSTGKAVLSTGRGRTMWIGGQGVTAVPVVGGEWLTSTGAPYTVELILKDLYGKTVAGFDGSRLAISGAVYIMLAS